MGRPEHPPPAVPVPRTGPRTGNWCLLVAKLLVASALLLGALRYFGGRIQLIPLHPPSGDGDDGSADTSNPVLALRQVYMQSTPQPPTALLALSAQGTQAGRLALRSWYDSQAQQARQRGYAFPFRLARWDAADSALPDVQLHASAREASEGYRIAFSAAADNTVKSNAESSVALEDDRTAEEGKAGSVHVRGTGRMLRRLRAQYLSGAHGRRHSYWSATPHRIPIDESHAEPESVETSWRYFVEDGLRIPNVTHRPTLASMARMVANAYQPTDSETWENLGDRWSTHDSFGWKGDGLRGHVFADKDNSTVVISLKGTSSTFFLGGGSETSVRDKYNDNRLFSCCCAYVDFTWSTVCDCHVSGNKCNSTCLENTMNDESSDNYFYAAAMIFMDVVKQYPDADIIFTGHSLGGSVASLLGLTFGLPTIAFEAPGDRLAAERLHLPKPTHGIMESIPLFHVGNTADPVYMGMCSGRTSSCYYAGYAMESKCHTGRQLVFDTVKYRDWRLDIRHHRINEVIYLVIESWGRMDPDETFPLLTAESKDCSDCGLWNFVNDTSPQVNPNLF
ncbi:putative lipase atg15 [Coemansia sp. Benny D115]|nr:putative lipase atg15 [Coemansia sp. Benny D115]